MPDALNGVERIDQEIEPYLAQMGKVFWASRNPDSGCTSYGVLAGDKRWFVKHADDPRGLASLERAHHLHSQVQHPALPRLCYTFRAQDGLVLVYEWVAGDPLYYPSHTPPAQRQDPAFLPVRFRTLPLPQILDALDTIYDVHLALAGQGFIAVDFYDGCILYDFEQARTYVCDLDEYRASPFVLDADRLPGSTRFMAPEEFRRGARIDQITNVFTLGRTAILLLGDGSGSWTSWKGTAEMQKVLTRATSPERAGRYRSVSAFVRAWRTVCGENSSLGIIDR